MIRLNCCIQAGTGNGVATATIPLGKYQSRRVNYMHHFVCSSSEKGFGDAATERRSGGAKKRGKRGKISSRPDPKQQMEKLQEQMEREAMPMKYQASSDQASSSAVEQSKDTSLATVPEQITNRMLKRILLFSGGPVMLGMLLFPAFYYVKKVQGIDLPVWAVYIIQTGVFGAGLLGISYGIISSSWDVSREGSLSGWNEFQANLPMVLDRFRKKDKS